MITNNKETTIKVKTEEEIMKENIASWKKEHGKVYESFVGGKGYIFRRLKRNEYGSIMSLVSGDTPMERVYNRQSAIVKAAVLYPELSEVEADMEELVGLATSISDEILEQSGFNVSSTVEL